MKRPFYYLVSLVLMGWIGCQNHQTTTPMLSPNLSSIDSLLTSEYENNRFDGTIVIGSKDRVIYQKAFGIANRTWNIPMSLDTRFDIASLNKSFTAALILLAEEEGKLSTEDLLSTYFPSCQFSSDITLHQMMCHLSGLPNYNDIATALQEKNYRPFKRLHFSGDAYAAFISDLKSPYPVNEGFHYSNFAYHLLAIILEKVHQKDFPVILDEKICKPLGLENTFSEISNEAVHPRVATGYLFDKGENTFYKNNFIDLTLGRRIFSTSEDLYKWGVSIQNRQLLNSKSTQKMFTNHLKGIEKEISYGYGWVINNSKKDLKMGDLGIDLPYIVHGGATEGYKAMLSNINNGEYIITHLSNIGYQTNELKITQKIAQILTAN